MAMSDIIAIGILIFCIVLGALGSFKWLIYLVAGMVVGLLILICISLLVENPQFDKLSQGIFRHGFVVPYIKSRVDRVEDFIRDRYVEPSGEMDICARKQDGKPFAAKIAMEHFNRLSE